jgi:hypothetical protein
MNSAPSGPANLRYRFSDLALHHTRQLLIYGSVFDRRDMLVSILVGQRFQPFSLALLSLFSSLLTLFCCYQHFPEITYLHGLFRVYIVSSTTFCVNVELLYAQNMNTFDVFVPACAMLRTTSCSQVSILAHPIIHPPPCAEVCHLGYVAIEMHSTTTNMRSIH